MNITQQIINKFKLSENEIIRISTDCKKEGINYGKSDRDPFSIDDIDFSIISDIADYFWYSTNSLHNKIKIGFALYDLFPRYFQFLMPYYRVVKNPEYCNLTKDDEKNYSNAKHLIWEKFMYYLGAENYYADPVGYVLWVQFFEDEETVNETWQGLIQFTDNKTAIKKLLEMSGPAPFELKEILYKKIIEDKQYHDSIFKSLLFSSFDLFGKIDNRKALAILEKLALKKDILHLDKLKNKLLEK